MESACSGLGPYRKTEVEEADCSSSGQKEYNFAVLVHGSMWLEVEEELSILATQCWAEGAWIGKWHQEQKKLG